MEGVRWGKGTFTSSDGNVYEGEWANDIREGEGKLTYKETEKIIVGKWVKDRLNGKGTTQAKYEEPVEVFFSDDIVIE